MGRRTDENGLLTEPMVECHECGLMREDDEEECGTCGSPRTVALDLEELDTIYKALVARSAKFTAFFSRAELEAHIIFGVLRHVKR